MFPVVNFIEDSAFEFDIPEVIDGVVDFELVVAVDVFDTKGVTDDVTREPVESLLNIIGIKVETISFVLIATINDDDVEEGITVGAETKLTVVVLVDNGKDVKPLVPPTEGLAVAETVNVERNGFVGKGVVSVVVVEDGVDAEVVEVIVDDVLLNCIDVDLLLPAAVVKEVVVAETTGVEWSSVVGSDVTLVAVINIVDEVEVKLFPFGVINVDAELDVTPVGSGGIVVDINDSVVLLIDAIDDGYKIEVCSSVLLFVTGVTNNVVVGSYIVEVK